MCLSSAAATATSAVTTQDTPRLFSTTVILLIYISQNPFFFNFKYISYFYWVQLLFIRIVEKMESNQWPNTLSTFKPFAQTQKLQPYAVLIQSFNHNHNLCIQVSLSKPFKLSLLFSYSLALDNLLPQWVLEKSCTSSILKQKPYG